MFIAEQDINAICSHISFNLVLHGSEVKPIWVFATNFCNKKQIELQKETLSILTAIWLQL